MSRILMGCLLLVTGLGWRIYQIRKVRFNRIKECEKKYQHLIESPNEMNYNDAGEILKVMHYWDLPWSMVLSLSLALFNTYAIPSISSVLSKTGELAQASTAARRAEDTVVFISEFLSQGLDSHRGSTSIARMNWLHSRWGKQITRGDLLYTLSLFIFEPIVFVAKYDWRPLTELEQEARYVFWREIGARMGIEDIPRTRQALWDWKEQYATDNMVYTETNAEVGALTMAVLVAPLPSFMKPFGMEAGKVFVEPRIMRAFGWQPASPSFLYWLVPALMRVRAVFIGYLMFPREHKPAFFESREEVVLKDGVEVEKRIQRNGFVFEPWYVPGGKSRIGQLGFGEPGDERKWSSSGWVSESLGPEKLRDQGVEATRLAGAEMRASAAFCPFFS